MTDMWAQDCPDPGRYVSMQCKLRIDTLPAWRAGAERETALKEFYDAWKGEPLVLLKWISIQVRGVAGCIACQVEDCLRPVSSKVLGRCC